MRIILSASAIFCMLGIISSTLWGEECTSSQINNYKFGFAYVEVAKRQVNDGSRYLGEALLTAEGKSKEDISEWVDACIAAAKANVAFQAGSHYFESAARVFKEAAPCSNSQESMEKSEQNANLAEDTAEEINSQFSDWCFDTKVKPYDISPGAPLYNDQFNLYDYRNYLE